MARAIWTGALAFGLVNVPVGLYSATEDKTIQFRQFQRGTSSRIRYRRVNEDTGEEVDYSDIVKGYELGTGEYVIVEPGELDEIAPGRSRTIDITDFVDAAEIDPIYYQKTYYLAPQNEAAERAYALLAEAMEKAGRIGIANFVMRSKQYLAAVRPQNGVLTLETMFFADEVRDPREELERLPEGSSPAKRDLDMAISLIDSMTAAWDPENYQDTYREKVLDLIEAKHRGDEVVTPGGPGGEGGGDVVELLDALRRSVEASREHRPGNRHQAGGLQTRPGSGAAGQNQADGNDLSSMAKKDLYELAKDLGLPGRSQMSKEELVEAITAAQRERKAS